MPSLFKKSSVEVLQRRQEGVDREIASLLNFRERIAKRIAHLKARGDAAPSTSV